MGYLDMWAYPSCGWYEGYRTGINTIGQLLRAVGTTSVFPLMFHRAIEKKGVVVFNALLVVSVAALIGWDDERTDSGKSPLYARWESK